MKKALVVYATREGQTEKVASAIATHLEALGFAVTLRNASGIAAEEVVRVSEYDLLIVGASMHAGGLEHELLRFVERHSEQLAVLARSLFVVLLSAASKDALTRDKMLADARTKIASQLGSSFDDVELIAGALAYSQYSRPMKWVMQHIARKAGGDTDTSRDYEYTDWDQVEAYARRLSAMTSRSHRDD